MNKYSFLLFLSLFTTGQLMAQNDRKVREGLQAVHNDTSAYLAQRILANKSLYIGKPLDSLLLHLPPVMRYINDDFPRNRYITTNTTLYFSSHMKVREDLRLKQVPALLVIVWATPLDKRELEKAGSSELGGGWSTAAHDFYKDKIIADIQMVQYNSH